MMDEKELQAIKDETGQLAVRLDNIEGYFANFDTTLTNHMTDYAKAQGAIREEQQKIHEKVDIIDVAVAKLQGSEGLAVFMVKWVVVPLIGLLAGLVGIKVLFPGAL